METPPPLGEVVLNIILHPVPCRQFVFSISIMLRIYSKCDLELLTKPCHCANESLRMFFRTLLGLDDDTLGMIMVIHTFGDYARFHPIFTPSWPINCFDRTGPFIACPRGT